MENITKTQFDELCVKPVQSKIDALRKRAETAEAQLDAVRIAIQSALDLSPYTNAADNMAEILWEALQESESSRHWVSRT